MKALAAALSRFATVVSSSVPLVSLQGEASLSARHVALFSLSIHFNSDPFVPLIRVGGGLGKGAIEALVLLFGYVYILCRKSYIIQTRHLTRPLKVHILYIKPLGIFHFLQKILKINLPFYASPTIVL